MLRPWPLAIRDYGATRSPLRRSSIRLCRASLVIAGCCMGAACRILLITKRPLGSKNEKASSCFHMEAFFHAQDRLGSKSAVPEVVSPPPRASNSFASSAAVTAKDRQELKCAVIDGRKKCHFARTCRSSCGLLGICSHLGPDSSRPIFGQAAPAARRVAWTIRGVQSQLAV